MLTALLYNDTCYQPETCLGCFPDMPLGQSLTSLHFDSFSRFFFLQLFVSFSFCCCHLIRLHSVIIAKCGDRPLLSLVDLLGIS
jgi:hypothetical protein